MKYLTFLFISLFISSTALAEDLELKDLSEVTITKVSSHNLEATWKGKTIKIRLLGLQCYAKSSNRVLSKLKGKSVKLRSDRSFLPILRDQRGRFVAYVEFEGSDIGVELVRSGVCENRGSTHPKTSEYAMLQK